MKKLLFLLLSFLLILSAITGCSSSTTVNTTPSSVKTDVSPSASQQASTPSADSSPIVIGYGLPVTGGASDTARQISRGAQLAIDQANADGGINGRQIQMLLSDDRGDPKEAANIANLFVTDDRVVAVVGHQTSSCTLAAAPIYEKNQMVNITPNASAVSISEAGPYTFRCWNSDKYIVKFLVQAILDRKYQKVGIVYQNDDYGRGGFNIFSEIMTQNNIVPTVTEGYLPGETKDFSTIITKFKNSGTEAVYIICTNTDISLFLLQCKQMDYHPFIIGNGLYANTVLEVAAEAAEGACGMALYNPANPPEGVVTFIKQYEEKFAALNDLLPTDKALCGYMATNMIIEAMRAKGTDREAIKDYLTTAEFETPLGKIKFDENGDIMFPLALMQVKDGKFDQVN